MSNIVFPATLTPGTPEDITDVDDNLKAIRDVVNGLLDGGNITDATLGSADLTTALAQVLGVTSGGVTRRGKSVIATEESRTDVAYGTLTTPDRVLAVNVPADSLLRIVFFALVKCSVNNAGRVGLFIGGNQLKAVDGDGAPAVQEVDPSEAGGTDFTDYGTVYTTSSGLVAIQASGDASLVTTGLAIGEIVVPVAAGSYDVEMRYKASSGSITAKERSLFVEAHSYA